MAEGSTRSLEWDTPAGLDSLEWERLAERKSPRWEQEAGWRR